MSLIKELAAYIEGSAWKQPVERLTGEIERGMIFHDVKMKVKDAIAFQDGTISPKVLLTYIKQPVGVWWYQVVEFSGSDSGLYADAEEYARDEETLGEKGGICTKFLEDAIAEKKNVVKVSIGIVLVAKNPKGWDPDDNPSNGLMGNSYISKRWKTVELVKIGHQALGKDWIYKPIKAIIRIR